MSCSLKPRIYIDDIKGIHDYLFGTDGDQSSDNLKDFNEDNWNVESWSENWEINETNSIQVKEESNKSKNNWLHDCLISLSPSFDSLVIASNGDAALLVPKRDASSVKSATKFTFSEKLYLCEEEGEYITSVLTLPIVSTKKTSYGSVDWNCLIVGFSTGYLRLYTENATKLMSQLFHEKLIVEIKCRTVDGGSGGGRRLSNSDDVDEVTILYEDALVVLDGFSLFQTLRACRSQVALAAASGGIAIDPPPMSYKKWTLTGGQTKITSHASVGTLHPSPFDQLKTASVLGGFNTDVRSAARSMSCYTMIGTSPFVGYYYAFEGSSQPLLSHVALAVASKLKSAIVSAASGWLSWGRGATHEASTPQKPKVELGTPLDIRCGIPDSLREGRTIVLAPGANISTLALAAMTDSLGRVILLDLAQNIAIRMWKGYRDAQVGFVRVFDDAHHKKSHRGEEISSETTTRRHALFLVIYAPRRGLLEVWACIHGPRVGAFNVSKNARLLHAGHGLLGTNGMSNHTLRVRTFQCCLLQDDGKIMEISIPYHLALSDGNSKRARDMHLLKKLNMVLHGRKQIEDEAYSLLQQMRICDTLRQGIEKLVQARHVTVEILAKCINAILNNIQQAGAVKKEEKSLVKFCNAQLMLIGLYKSMLKLNDQSTMLSITGQKKDVSIAELSESLQMSHVDMEEVVTVLSVHEHSLQRSKVKFEVEDVKPIMTIAEFLSCFNVVETSSNVETPSDVQLKMENEHKMKLLGSFLFQSSVFGSTLPQDVLFAINERGSLKHLNIMKLVLDHWTENTQLILADFKETTNRLYVYINELSSSQNLVIGALQSSSNLKDEEDIHMRLWEWIRQNVCQPTHDVLAAYVLALVCRSISVQMKNKQKNIEKEDELEQMDVSNDAHPPSYEESCQGEKFVSTSGEWETLWIDTEKWNLVIKQLEDCVYINTQLTIAKPQRSGDEAMKNADNLTISLGDVLTKGTGLFAESISKCICSLKLKPGLLNKDEFKSIPDSWKTENEDSYKFLLFLHENLLPRFPFSLAIDVLHAHCFWENLVIWNKDHEEISFLSNGLLHLSQVKYDVHARHGLAVMAWKMSMVKKVIQLAQLIDKVGKAPKDRLCRKEVGVSDTKMSSFCQSCRQLLQIIADADLDLVPTPDVAVVPGNSFEDSWQNIQGQRSIVDMGRSHPRANYGLVQHLMHLCFILHATMKYGLRGVKPFSRLFDVRGRKCFAVDIHAKDVALPNPDSIEIAISKYRQEFLDKTVSAAVERLHQAIERNSDSKREYEEEKEWIENAIHIAYEFQIDSDKPRVQYVTLLYSFGQDELAFEAATEVSDKDCLSNNLLSIVGQRLNHIINHVRPEQGVVMMSQIPTIITLWIKSQDATLLKVTDISVHDTLALSRYVLSIMSESNSLHDTALYIEQAVQSIS